jgi:hypothetical protein
LQKLTKGKGREKKVVVHLHNPGIWKLKNNNHFCDFGTK